MSSLYVTMIEAPLSWSFPKGFLSVPQQFLWIRVYRFEALSSDYPDKI